MNRLSVNIAVVSTMVFMFLSGSAMASTNQATLTNGLDTGISLSCSVNNGGAITIASGSSHVFKASSDGKDGPYFASVQCGPIERPEGVTAEPSDANISFGIDNPTGSNKFFLYNSGGASWLACSGSGCSAGTQGVTSNNQTMKFSYNTSAS